MCVVGSNSTPLSPPTSSSHPSIFLDASTRFYSLDKNDLKAFRKRAVDLASAWNKAHGLSDVLSPANDGRTSRQRRQTVMPNIGGEAGSGGGGGRERGSGGARGGRSSSSSSSSSKEWQLHQKNQKLQKVVNVMKGKLANAEKERKHSEKKRKQASKKEKKESKKAKKQRTPSPSPPPAAPSPFVLQMSDGARLAVSSMAQSQASLLGDLARMAAQGGNMVAAQSFAANAGVSTGIAMDVVGKGMLPVPILPAP